MDLSTITVQDFKTLFFRDFPYLPQWDAAATYQTGSIVFNNDVFYKALSTNTNSEPPSADWESVSENKNDFILDADIDKAFGEAQQVFNQALYGTDDNIQRAYLYLTAHYLVVDIRASQGAFEAGAGTMASRSVGSVSENYQVPQQWLDDVIMFPYTTTHYGIKWLSFTTPHLIGNFGIARGTTLA